MSASPAPSIDRYTIYYRWNNANVLSRIFSNDWGTVIHEFERLAGDTRATDIQLLEGHLIATANSQQGF